MSEQFGIAGVRLAVGSVLASAAVCAALLPGFAFAQQQGATETSPPPSEKIAIEDIVVTASRIDRSGFAAPTPTTVLGAEEIKLSGASNIADLLNETPSFKSSVTPSSTTTSAGSAGQNILALRGLGATRTLVLVDGRRHVPSNAGGTFNLNVIPSGLIERVEVVTGGASAAWGSDAVAGVVNLILDHDREGFSGSAQYGMSNYGDGEEYRAELTYGSSFAQGRGHFLISAEAADNQGVLKQSDRGWGRQGWQVIANPDYTPGSGQPQRLIVPDAHIANATPGGLIVGPGQFRNIEFGPGGIPGSFVRGEHAGTSFMQGGDGVNLGYDVTLQVPVERQAVFSRGSFELAENLNVFAEASYGRTYSDMAILPTFDFGTLRISRDNAFLPDSLRQDMATAGVNELLVGRLNTDFGYVRSENENVTKRGVLGLNGSFGATWRWDAYAQYGKTRIDGRLNNNRLEGRFRQALDSVIDPITGEAVCRSSLTNPGDGCVALNIFGEGSPSAAALAYIIADQVQITELEQTVYGANLSGEPFSTWAGPISTAFGAEYRRDATEQAVDALTASGSFTLGNASPLNGSYNVREAYAEAVIPLAAAEAWAKSLDLNLAVRGTDYNISGFETTWKAGATWQINDSLRLRTTRSRDIRAPNLGELFAQTATIFRTVTDPSTGLQSNIRMLRGGNPNLEAERADTITAGVVYEPGWAPGLRASMDFYDIQIEGAVGTLEAQDIVSRCANGAAQLCSLIQRDGSGAIQTVQATLINLSTLKTRGADFELSYSTPLSSLFGGAPGDLWVRMLATYVDTLITDDGVNAIDRAGDVGPFVDGMPHWRWNASVAYSLGSTTVQMQGRYVGGGAYDHTFNPRFNNGELGIDDNTVSNRFYVDLSLQHDMMFGAGEAQAFFSVNNLLDRDPPLAPDTVFIPLATNKQIYDVIGRYFIAGLRFNY